MGERRFNEKELVEILRRAGRRQSTGGDPNSYSLSEIQRLAAEVGIEPGLVAAEASRYTDGPKESAGLWGATSNLFRDLTIPGEISEETWEDIISELRAAYGGPGKSSKSGRSREWSGGTDLTRAHLAVSRRGEESRLRLTLRQEGGLAMYWALGFPFTFVVTMATFAATRSNHLPGGIIAVAMLSMVCLCLLGLNRMSAKLQRKNLRTTDEFVVRVLQLTQAAQSAQGGLSNLARTRDRHGIARLATAPGVVVTLGYGFSRMPGPVWDKPSSRYRFPAP